MTAQCSQEVTFFFLIRRGRQRMRWLDGIADSVDMSLSKWRQWRREWGMRDREAWRVAVAESDMTQWGNSDNKLFCKVVVPFYIPNSENSSFPTLSPTLGVVRFFLVLAILTGMWWYLSVILMCISLVTDYVATPRGAWRATVHGITMSQTWLSNWAHRH